MRSVINGMYCYIMYITECISGKNLDLYYRSPLQTTRHPTVRHALS